MFFVFPRIAIFLLLLFQVSRAKDKVNYKPVYIMMHSLKKLKILSLYPKNQFREVMYFAQFILNEMFPVPLFKRFFHIFGGSVCVRGDLLLADLKSL